MAKFTILGRLRAERAIRALPPEYRDRAQAAVDPAIEYTVVLFAHDRADVVTSATVRRALTRLPPAEAVLAAGANFTAEATALLEQRGAAIARLGEFYWTDESYLSLPR